MLSVKVEKKQNKAERESKMAVKVLLVVLHLPLLVRRGLRNWKKKVVPVGRSLMMFERSWKSVVVVVVVVLVDDPMVEVV